MEKPPPSPTECARHNDVRQTEILTAEQLVCEPSVLMIEFPIENLERYKSPGIDTIPAKMMQSGGRRVGTVVHKPTSYILNKGKSPQQWKVFVTSPFFKTGN